MSTFFFLVRNAHFFLAIFQGTVLMCIFFKIGDPGEGSGTLEVGGGSSIFDTNGRILDLWDPKLSPISGPSSCNPPPWGGRTSGADWVGPDPPKASHPQVVDGTKMSCQALRAFYEEQIQDAQARGQGFF